MKQIKKIDIHCHVLAFPDYMPVWPRDKLRFLSKEQQWEFFDKLNVEMGGLLPVVAPECQWMTFSNQEEKWLVDQHPDKFFWYCNVDPRQAQYGPDSALEYLIEYYKNMGAKGVGEVTTQLYADDPMMDNLFGACERQDMPVLIHIGPHFYGSYGIVDEAGLPRIERMLQKHPNLKLIGHSAAFWSEISNDCPEEQRNGYPKGKVTEGRVAELLRLYPNLYCDISAGSGHNAMMRDPEYTAKFIEEFSDRILYGTDICKVTSVGPMKFDEFLTQMVEDGKVSEENYRKIVRGNAIKLFNLDLEP